ncbi:MAG: PEGA domain-containing protein [bacterium]
MKKVLLIIFASIFLGGCTAKDLFVKAPAGLEIATIPTSTVFINGDNKGETPYSDKNLKPGSYTVKLVPTGSTTLSPYETKLELVSKASTIISRTFTESEIDSSGYTLQLQEDPAGLTYLSVISDPDNVNITIDDKPSGFTPLSKSPTSPGSHSLLVTSPGFLEQSLSVNTVKGYNLIVNFKLASQTITLTPSTPSTPSASVEPSATPSAVASSSLPSASVSPSTVSMAKPYVLIGETGTGWLRIRKTDSGTSEELGKANTGEKLKYLGESTDLGWHKIEFEGAVGWVSGKYVTLVK